jgi:hypothetical protein
MANVKAVWRTDFMTASPSESGLISVQEPREQVVATVSFVVRRYYTPE